MKKKFWKKGSAESLGMLFMLPMILVLIMILVSFVQLTSFCEKLEYTTYVACRAASASASKEEAEENALAVAKANLATYSVTNLAADSNATEEVGVTVTIEYIDSGMDPVTEGADYNEWVKGNYIICTVEAEYIPMTTIAGSSAKSRSIVMAIEYSE